MLGFIKKAGLPYEALREVWHPLRDSLVNQMAPIKQSLSMIQTLFAEFDK